MNLHEPVRSWNDLKSRWGDQRNLLLADECVPFEFAFPPLDHVVAELRDDPDVRISEGVKGATLNVTDISEAFRKLPIEKAMESPFAIGHFKLSNFDKPGRFLHGFERAVLDPWRQALTSHGFTFQRCYPIIFISGRNCATNYHMDFSHVIAWQIYGHKNFCGFHEPNRWTSHEERVTYAPAKLHKPANLRDEDCLCFDMKPGDVLWNWLLTPHWVEASDEPAMSVNLSHGGLRCDGQLTPNEQELDDYRQTQPNKDHGVVKASY